MIRLLIDRVPHFIVKDPQTRDLEKQEILQEYTAFFRLLLGAYSELGLQIHAEQNDRGKDLSFAYLFPNAYFPVQALAREMRYLKVKASNPETPLGPMDRRGAEALIQRKMRLIPVGDLPYTRGHHSLLPEQVAVQERLVYKIPNIRHIQLMTTDYKWRHTLETIAGLSGTLDIHIRKFQPQPSDIVYAQQCLTWYLHTYQSKLPVQEIRAQTYLYQALLADEDTFEVTVNTGQVNPQAIQLAFVRDTDSEAFTTRAFSWDENVFSAVAPDSRDFIKRLPNIWTIDEVIRVITPPYTFRDAIAGMRHFVPKPFFIPSMESQNGEREEARLDDSNSVCLGNLDDRTPVRVSFKRLRSHLFVAGTTGSGKTTTIKHILRQLNGKIPFLIIDPAKREYADLMEEFGLSDNILDFTKDRFPHFNPFIPPQGITLYAHSSVIARMLSIFFPTSPVAYEFLVNMVRQAYITKITQRRAGLGRENTLDMKVFLAFTGRDLRRRPYLTPTFQEFMEFGLNWLQSPKVTNPNSRYGQEAVEHFVRRFEFLRLSLFMHIFGDPQAQHEPIDKYLGIGENGASYLIQLYNVLDSNESNSLFALFVAMLYEHRISAKEKDDLVHLTILEEAHRIVPSAQETWGEDAVNSPAQEAGKLLAHMLAELRALGEGICVADQSPSKIIPDLLINTATKIVHRILYGVDKEYLGSAMSLSDRESNFLAYLDDGEAIAFSSDAYQPLYLKVPFPTSQGE